MTDKMIEAVARALCDPENSIVPCPNICDYCRKDAEAAIAAARPFILDEAAKVADDVGHNLRNIHSTMPSGAYQAAAAIRAAKEG